MFTCSTAILHALRAQQQSALPYQHHHSPILCILNFFCTYSPTAVMMPPTTRASSSSHSRSVSDQVDNAHYSTSQPRVRESHPAESVEPTRKRSISHSSCNPGPVAQDFPNRPASPAFPRKHWRIRGFVDDSEGSESEAEAKLHKGQAVPDLPLTRPAQGDSVKIPVEYQVSNWVSYVPPVRPDTIPLVRADEFTPLRRSNSSDSASTVPTDILRGIVQTQLEVFVSHLSFRISCLLEHDDPMILGLRRTPADTYRF